MKVQFHWDEIGQSDENSSAWIRVAQVSAGNGWGSLVIPRVGHEVLVDFIEGDPSRPVIVGSLYNGSNPPPYSLPDEKTKTAVRTRSTPGGGGSNELRFEDKAGEEQVYLHAQKDLEVVVGDNVAQSVGNDLTLAVRNNTTVATGNNYTNVVGHDHVVTTGKDFSHTIGSKFTCTVGTNALMSAKTLTLQAVDQITLQVGNASLVMKKNGDIKLGGKKIDIKATGPLNMKGSNTT